MLDELIDLGPDTFEYVPAQPATIEEAWAQLQSVPSYCERHQRRASEAEAQELESDYWADIASVL